MTNRYSAILVILEKDTREDDAEATINAIKQLRGVLVVEPQVTKATELAVASARIRNELREKLFKVLYDE